MDKKASLNCIDAHWRCYGFCFANFQRICWFSKVYFSNQVLFLAYYMTIYKMAFFCFMIKMLTKIRLSLIKKIGLKWNEKWTILRRLWGRMHLVDEGLVDHGHCLTMQDLSRHIPLLSLCVHKLLCHRLDHKSYSRWSVNIAVQQVWCHQKWYLTKSFSLEVH